MANTGTVNLDSFGVFFSYEIPSVTWSQQLVEDLYDNNNILEKHQRPFLPNDSSAFGRTMRVMQDRGANPLPRQERRAFGDSRPTVVRQPLDPGHIVIFTKMDNKTGVNTTFRVNRGTKMGDKESMEYKNSILWTPSGLEFDTDYLKEDILREYENQRTYNHQDVRASIIKLLTTCKPLPLKGYTALFFPKEFIGTVNSVSGVLKGLNCEMVRLDIAATPESRDDLIKHFMSSVKADLDEAERDLTERLDGAVETKESTWEKRQSTLSDVRAKIEYFSSLLNCASDSLVERLGKLQAKLRQALVMGTELVEDVKPQPVATVSSTDPFKDLTA